MYREAGDTCKAVIKMADVHGDYATIKFRSAVLKIKHYYVPCFDVILLDRLWFDIVWFKREFSHIFFLFIISGNFKTTRQYY